MRWRKRTKTIDDISVEKLFDDFVDIRAENDSKHLNDIDDDEYVTMMLKKDANRKLERLKRKPKSMEESPSGDEIHEVLQQHNEPEPEKIEGPEKSEMLPEDEAMVEEIMKSQSIGDIPALTGRMKVAVDFVQWEMGSVSNRKRQKS